MDIIFIIFIGLFCIEAACNDKLKILCFVKDVHELCSCIEYHTQDENKHFENFRLACLCSFVILKILRSPQKLCIRVYFDIVS